jgi:hypothetical protein
MERFEVRVTADTRRVITMSRLVLPVIALAFSLALVGCASGPLGSHGVDNIPAFQTGPQGVGR